MDNNNANGISKRMVFDSSITSPGQYGKHCQWR